MVRQFDPYSDKIWLDRASWVQGVGTSTTVSQ